MPDSWKTKSSKVVYENPWMLVREDEVIHPNGANGLYGYIESKSGSVLVVPVDEEGNTYIVQQERYTLKRKVWELVAGRADSQNLEEDARRELLEETGLQANSWVQLATLDIASGLSNLNTSVWLARDLTKVSDELDSVDGIIAARKVSFAEFKNMIASGEMVSSSSIAAFFLAMSYLEEGEK